MYLRIRGSGGAHPSEPDISCFPSLIFFSKPSTIQVYGIIKRQTVSLFNITMKTGGEKDIHFMRLALEEAEEAFKKGEVPVGAVLVRNGSAIAAAYNLRESLKDPSAHAEILALRVGTVLSDSWRIESGTLYVTKEPCIMCAGAVVNARVARLVYGCRDGRAGGVDSLYHILNDKRLNHQVEVTSGILEKECAELLRKFFQERR
jgi:tRNA(adenine34) deaminase